MNHRRGFLRLAAGSAFAAAAGPGLLAACNVLPGAQSGPGSSGAAPSGGTLKLPTYLPFQGPQADLPATADGVPPAYTSFPRQLAKSVSSPPGKGGDITIMTYTMFAPVPGHAKVYAGGRMKVLTGGR